MALSRAAVSACESDAFDAASGSVRADAQDESFAGGWEAGGRRGTYDQSSRASRLRVGYGDSFFAADTARPTIGVHFDWAAYNNVAARVLDSVMLHC
jgi:hypothetical protein